MEEDEKWGAWERQKDGGEKKLRGRENADTKRKKGRRQRRGQTEIKQPRQPAASVINNMCPTCDRQSRAPAGLGPWICYITATHSNILRLLGQDIVLK